jgi:hypothetical protein
MKRNRIIYSISIVGLAALILMLNTLSPTEIGPLGVLLFFTTVYLTLFGISVFLFQTFIKMALKRTTMSNKEYLYCAIFTFGPIMFLMARSFDSVNLWTSALIILFLFLTEFLVYKRV